MKSDFERMRAREAVEAVEARWQRTHDNELRMKRQGHLHGLLSLVAVLLIAGGVWLFWQWRHGGLPDGIQGLSTCWHAMTDKEYGKVEVRPSYGADLRRMLAAPVSLLSAMPSEDNPAKAPAGKSFVVLACPKGRDFALYRMTADGKGGLSVTLRSPFAEGRSLSWAAFKKSCDAPYLIEVPSGVYLCGSRDLREAERLRQQVRGMVGFRGGR